MSTLRSRFIAATLVGAFICAVAMLLSHRYRLDALTVALAVVLVCWVVALIFSLRPERALAQLEARLSQVRAGKSDVEASLDSGEPLLESSIASLRQIALQYTQAREEAERRLRESQSVLDDLADAVIAVDARGVVMRVNPAAGVLYGQLPHRVMIGRTVLEATLDHSLEAMVRRCLEHRTAVEQVLEVHAPRERSLAAAVIPRIARDGRLEGAVAVLHDVSELRALDRRQREFTANASHELRTPVAAIRVMAESLLRGALQDAELGPRFVQSIADSAGRLSALVDDLMFLSIRESGGQRQTQRVDLAEIAAGVCERMRPLARERGLQLDFHPAEACMVEADPLDLSRAVTNLVDNAVRYTDPGGRVEVAASSGGGQVRVSVADTGIGIAPDQMDRIFERFYRVDAARSRETGGTGLGLSIVREIAQRWGGTVSVDSTLGEGARFMLSFPEVPADTARPPEPPDHLAPSP